MHYDALIHREITTHIARYISCGLNRINDQTKNEDCSDILKSILDQIDQKITPIDQKILNEYRTRNINFDTIETLNEKEKQLMYLIDYYENR
jgi:predicted secreted Zn-dependent protease